jgi:hypothetical protein
MVRQSFWPSAIYHKPSPPMPIKFRCPHCEQFLGISRSKAGAVTDCPTCGRTIRVPQLDGKTAPLPKPEMNHGDSGLAKALNALASLGDGAAAVAEVEPVPAKAVAIVLAPAPALEPIPVPVPLPPEPPVRPAVAGISHPTPPPHSREASAPPSADLFRELSSIQPPSGSRSRRSLSEKQPLLITGVVCGLLGIGSGFLLGRMTGSGDSGTVAVPIAQNPAPAEAGPLAPAAPGPGIATPEESLTLVGDLKLAIEGRVTYVTATGENRPDVGARILVLPARRPAASKLSVMSFRAGANSSDVKLAQASVRALGGDFVLAGPDGHYEIKLSAIGPYQLLIVSKYQARDPDTQTDVSAIQDWFDQPRSFFGQTQVMSAPLQFNGQRSEIRDHVFPKAD